MAKLVCTACHTVGKVKTETKGSFLVEVALWVLFCLPGIIYTLWRMTSGTKVCKACGSHQLVPVNSPVGRQLTGGR